MWRTERWPLLLYPLTAIAGGYKYTTNWVDHWIQGKKVNISSFLLKLAVEEACQNFPKYYVSTDTCMSQNNTQTYKDGCNNDLCTVLINTNAGEFNFHSWRGMVDTTLCHQICQWSVLSICTPVSSINKTYRRDITKILLKMRVNTHYPIHCTS